MDSSAKRVEIIPAKRRAMILEFLRERGVMSIQELTASIGASISTVRRDLDQLTEAGYLERTFGGAMLATATPATFEMEPSIVAQIALPQKRGIGAIAAERLKPGESVIFDGSTTVLEAARAAAQRGLRLTAVTNGLDIALALLGSPAISVVVTGGTVRGRFASLVGDPGKEFLETVHADICLLGIHAISGTLLTEASFEGAAVKRAMLHASRRRILLADSSKFQVPALSTVCDLSMFEELITDDGIGAEQLAALRAMRLRVTVVEIDRGSGRAATPIPPAAAPLRRS
jgi:DeoR family transcriptional regulator, aga operon transcriptional repressor